MIELTRLNGHKIVVNLDLIKFIEATPDTLLTLSTGDKLMVQESVEEVLERVIVFRRSIQFPLVRPLEIEGLQGCDTMG
ncbi:flagellar protein [bacterium (Candidatus Blackallbacteria) CG17_big_fil_post_rev_8_21_14_2_50_48_46]|uniref:Flagellar protein n=1 Tax=bacterium (Candidatus Blackallbacteria) CG17_big_fil_post_rev_8_21_14_2_50_48_46 TaxID=2014261 RepID=A0A2M7G3U6_9BACT|nr:MAG: flagellar protein [bacterium (Candidatus Blackallbacteria) CG18_big_fil_WC_8_21_14_2_50_49_26]PIW16550.1 MAG: flagellar protein [bacterium (Candidatus Blackallbacteria) CG17_big_fil_post_rev_8_21_14_2_50_48_46]PIW46058.1 MAG: flagellar protein [bacterium (Candidatus Blackallbacteria) CG13_big_fil_rev_8_21_14_2_50_49_14]